MATTAGSRPALSSSSTGARCSLDTEPWWARAISAARAARAPGLGHDLRPAERAGRAARSPVARSSAISLSRAVNRSASRRELANTIVDRCCSIRSRIRSSTCGQIDVRRSAAGRRAAAPRRSSSPSSVMSSTGTTTLSSTASAPAAARRSTSRAPPRNRATSSTGRTVADSPMRWAGCGEQLVEPLERQREVGAALGPGDGVHLVDDHGLDAAQRLAGLRGQHQEERLGRRDEDVGRRGREPAALVGRRVAGADADRDVGLGQR